MVDRGENYDEIEVRFAVEGPNHNGEYYVRVFDFANDKDTRFTTHTPKEGLDCAAKWLGWD